MKSKRYFWQNHYTTFLRTAFFVEIFMGEKIQEISVRISVDIPIGIFGSISGVVVVDIFGRNPEVNSSKAYNHLNKDK